MLGEHIKTDLDALLGQIDSALSIETEPAAGLVPFQLPADDQTDADNRKGMRSSRCAPNAGNSGLTQDAC
jgi:hypothetical protein